MDKTLTLVEHLGELRRRIIICLAALTVTSIISFPFASFFLKVLKLPAAGLIEKLAFFSPQEAFLIYMRIAFLCGICISLPVIFYQVWAFISPAVEERFKNRMGFFVIFCSIAFIAGGLFAYFVLIPPALKFLLSFGQDELEPVISAATYISFIISLILACGVIFQLPILSFILSKLGVISSNFLRKKYKYAILAISIIAALITPTADVFNMLLLALPMLFLYEVSVWVSYFARPRQIKENTEKA